MSNNMFRQHIWLLSADKSKLITQSLRHHFHGMPHTEFGPVKLGATDHEQW